MRVERILRRLELDRHIDSEVLAGTSGLLLLKVLGAALGLGVSLLLAQLLGADKVGVYFLALTIVSVSSVLGTFGLDTAVLRLVANLLAVGELSSATSTLRKALFMAAVFSGALSAIVFIGAPAVSEYVFKERELATPLKVMTVAIAPMALIHVAGGGLKALDKPHHGVAVTSVFTHALSLIIIPLLIAQYATEGAAAGYAISALIAALVGIWFVEKYSPGTASVWSRLGLGVDKILELARPLLLMAGLGLVMTWSDIVLIGVFRDSNEVGVYGVANKVARVISFVLLAASSLIAPRIARAWEKGNVATVRTLVSATSRASGAIAFPVFVVLIVFPTWFLSFFGEEFVRGEWALRLLGAGHFIDAVLGIAVYALIMSAFEIQARNIVLLAAVVNIVLNIALIPAFGLAGAASATAIAVSLKAGLAMVFFHGRVAAL